MLARLDREGEAFEEWRSKHKELLSTLKTFMASATALGDVVRDAAFRTPFPAASPILGGILYLTKVFREMQDYSNCLAQYLKVEMDNVLMTKVSATLKL
ncbi:hypothetical protein LTR04_005702 [Oleoguttula sp. CCFEE 6159]|nr:hypothetical protein LTR04_005702 [Oleoguttula sp. CCFEE 6159]